MIRLRYNIAYLLLAASTVLQAQAHVTMQVEGDSVEIGVPIRLTYNLRWPIDVQLELVDLSTLDSTANQLAGRGGIFMDEFLDWDVSGQGVVIGEDRTISVEDLPIGTVNSQSATTVSFDLVPYSVGQFTLPFSHLAFDKRLVVQTGTPSTLVVLPPDSLRQDVELAPIRDIRLEQKTWEDYLIYILPVALLLLGVLLWRWFRNRPTSQEIVVEPVVPPAPRRPAHLIALEALDGLDRARLWQQGEIQEYQSRLTGIMRQYLADRYGIAAMEETTAEIRKSLRAIDLHPQYADKVIDVLQVADLVKFAKATPEESIHQQFLEGARELVRNTQEKEVTE